MEPDVNLLAQFKEKVCDCIGIVCKMDPGDRLQAVHFWNQVSVRLQSVLDRRVTLTVHSIKRIPPANHHQPAKGEVVLQNQAQIENVINTPPPPDQEKPDGKKSNQHESPPDILINQKSAIEIANNQDAMKQSDAPSNIVDDKSLDGGLEDLLIGQKEGMDNIIVTHQPTTEGETEIGEIVVTATAQEIENGDGATKKDIEMIPVVTESQEQSTIVVGAFHQESGGESLITTEEAVSFIPNIQTCSEEIVPILSEESETCLEQNANISEVIEEDSEVQFLTVEENSEEVDDPSSSQQEESQIIIDEVSELQCLQCPMETFSTLDELTNHSKFHKKPFVCDVCCQAFSTKGSLKVHSRKHTGEKPYKCNACDQSFSTPGNLKRHKNTHTGVQPFQCDWCKNRFTTRKNLKSHMLIHSGEKPYSCNICQARFTQSSTLKSHMKIHEDKKAYTCDICNKSFVQKSNMTSHRMRHSSERKHECAYCAHKFLSKSDLTRHTRCHLAPMAVGDHVTLFQCSECNKSFSRNYLLTNHMHKEHSKFKPWKCTMCQEKFVSRANLLDHLKASQNDASHKSLVQPDVQNLSIQNQFIIKLKENKQAEVPIPAVHTDIPPD
eukprot:TRINITY_DN2967_c2_g1_i4.p1 TRINITY_DN2967_c2_g1~~TRINITY_DN2967_c2_g1_i4.p1  ORF type:complete len:610 (-),score=95.44 TRINITY_DN2967_c2_g1_i4:144-1973(-)